MKKSTSLFILFVSLLGYTNAQWTHGSGIDGGDFRCLAKAGTDIYAGSQYGGVFRSSNNGDTWTPLLNGLPGGVAVLKFMDSGTKLFAGTGYWSTTGKGVYRSDDNGETWVQKNNGIQVNASPNYNDLNITGLAKNTSYIFAATQANGIYRSVDNGDNWIKIFNEYTPDSIYREIRALCTIGDVIIAGGSYGDGIYRSIDNGISWVAISTGLPSGFIVYGLISNGTNLYATTSHGFYWSPSNGDYWIGISNGISQPMGAANGAISADGNIVYASTNDGTEGPKTYKSTNNGSSFVEIPSMSIYRVSALFAEGSNVFACNLGGIYNYILTTGGVVRSTDNGDSWNPSNSGLSGLTCTSLTSNGTEIYAGSKYYSGIFKSSNNGNTWSKSILPGTTTNYQVLSMLNVGVDIYAGNNTYTTSGGVFKTSDNGQNWTASGTIGKPIYALGANSTYIYAGTSNDGMRRSSNGGITWATINSGLPTIGEKSIRCLSVNGSKLHIGTSRGIFISNNDGTTWTPANGGVGSPGYGTKNSVIVKGDTILAGSSGIARSFDNGVTWSSLPSTGGLGKALIYVGNTIYAGGTAGVFVSNDWGDSWNSISETFPLIPEVNSLHIVNNILYAGTSGLSVWTYDLSAVPTAFNVVGSGSYCENTGGLPVGVADSEIGITYTLIKDGIAQVPAISGTGSAISFGNQFAGTYTVKGTIGTGAFTMMTGSSIITEIPSVNASVTITSDVNNVCAGTPVTFMANPVGGGSAPTYQWFKNNVAVASGDIYTYIPDNGDIVYSLMTSNAICAVVSPAVSNAIAMIVNPLIPVSVTVAVSQNNICTGTSVTFTAAPLGGGTAPTYQWFVNNVVVATGLTYSYIPVNSDVIYAVMTSNVPCAANSSDTSNSITMIVSSVVTASVSISVDQNNVCEGALVALTATPLGGGPAPTYQWFKNTVAVANGNTFSYTPVNGDNIYVLMTSNASCVIGNPATSNTITMAVNPLVPVSVTVVESQNNVCAGTPITFTPIPVGGGVAPIYQWFKNNVAVATSNTYTYIAENGDVVYAVITSNIACATGNPATSNSINMTVIPLVPTGVSIIESQNNVCNGTSVVYTATPIGGGVAPTYQWFTNNIAVATGNTFTYIPENGDVVYSTMTSNIACPAVNPITSNTITMEVNPLVTPDVTIMASQNNVCAGISITCTANPVNGGTTPVYQWYKNGVAIATGSTYVDVHENNDVIYSIMTSNAACLTNATATSNSITMVINPLPATAGLINGIAEICAGTTQLEYSVAEITNASSYEWTIPSGVTITNGSGTNTITVDYSMAASSGIMQVYGVNSCGNGIASPTYTVTVNAIPATPVISQTGSTLYSTAPTGNQWYKDGIQIPGATQATYNVTADGTYYSIVTVNNCSSGLSNSIFVLFTGSANAEKIQIELYPVPNNGLFDVMITCPSNDQFDIGIYTNTGSLVYEQKDLHVNGTIKQHIDMQSMPSGTYIMTFTSTDTRVIRKLVINK